MERDDLDKSKDSPYYDQSSLKILSGGSRRSVRQLLLSLGDSHGLAGTDRVVGEDLLGHALTADLVMQELSSLPGANEWYLPRFDMTVGRKRTIDANRMPVQFILFDKDYCRRMVCLYLFTRRTSL